jgi:hypothetical protein
VNTSQYISAGHEDLSGRVSLCTSQWKIRAKLARSKAVLHALGCVATKIGLVDIFLDFKKVDLMINFEQSIFQVVLESSRRIDCISGQLKSQPVSSSGPLKIQKWMGDGNCL